ncbi:MAG: hypothetical protein CHACPFDD_02925 [Phycisphaerae bacterium]|nr:hypothetical protein [Phycisphaerae bacterium]
MSVRASAATAESMTAYSDSYVSGAVNPSANRVISRMERGSDPVTSLLNSASAGDPAAASRLLEMIYDELQMLARAQMRGAGGGQTLQPTALVHEAYMRLFAGQGTTWNSRGHFFAAAARAMRNILVDQARRRGSQKRGGGRRAVGLDDVEPAFDAPSDDILALDEALDELERSDPRKARIAMLHVFAGLSLADVAAALEVSLSTIEREWRFTRALLSERLADRDPTDL